MRFRSPHNFSAFVENSRKIQSRYAANLRKKQESLEAFKNGEFGY